MDIAEVAASFKIVNSSLREEFVVKVPAPPSLALCAPTVSPLCCPHPFCLLVQFPIKMSLPWILLDHVVNSPNTARLENLLFPLDIYNDAAARALNVLRKRFVFDEIQARLNRVLVYAARTLNAKHHSRVSLSPR